MFQGYTEYIIYHARLYFIATEIIHAETSVSIGNYEQS